MNEVATVDDYLQEAGALDKAMLPLGFLLAFCAQHRLLSQAFTEWHCCKPALSSRSTPGGAGNDALCCPWSDAVHQ